MNFKVENLSVSYDGMVALNQVSLEVNEGDIIGILGANGAGKSTLLNTISGLKKPDSGQIFFDGQDLTKMKPYEVAELGVVQVPEGRKLFPLLTVEENLLVGGHIKKARATRNEMVEEIYATWPRLKERSKQLAKTLSGGEQQMLALGRALMTKPKLLMMDEPTLGLAPIIVSDVYKQIQAINEKGIAILLSEQNVVKTLKIATRAYVIENGTVTLEGTGAELLGNEHVKKAFIGM